MMDYLSLSPEIKTAIEEEKPVVALESTIIAHGMPYPQNVKTALDVEAMVRVNGAIPATIALINGKMKVGLSADEIDQLGRLGEQFIKTSRRDIPLLLATQGNGATTVASTMIIAKMAGIKFFVTGGIGGVHHAAQETMDISADLQELAKTNVAVISAGAKSILDLKLTLEYLETHGVPVYGFGTAEFPAFYTRKSGLGVDARIDDIRLLAKAIKTKWEIGLTGGILIANPIPEKYEVAFDYINQAIEEAIKVSQQKGIKGKAITPFLLGYIKDITKGESLRANIQLVLNNAQLGAKLARAYYS